MALPSISDSTRSTAGGKERRWECGRFHDVCIATRMGTVNKKETHFNSGHVRLCPPNKACSTPLHHIYSKEMAPGENIHIIAERF